MATVPAPGPSATPSDAQQPASGVGPPGTPSVASPSLVSAATPNEPSTPRRTPSPRIESASATPAQAPSSPTAPAPPRPELPPGFRRASSSGASSASFETPAAAAAAASPNATTGAPVGASFVAPFSAPPLRGWASLAQRLKAADRYWAWKVAIRTFILAVGAVGIACCYWIMSFGGYSSNRYRFGGYTADKSTAPPALAVLSFSLLWCLVAIFFPIANRPRHQPIHPGLLVATDLIFWIALVLTAVFCAITVNMVLQFGSNPSYLADPSYHSYYSGNYYLNTTTDTWVYNVTDSYANGNRDPLRYNYTDGTWYYDKPAPNMTTRACGPYFDTCAEQDAFVNALWWGRNDHRAIGITSAVMQALAALGHFVLFVWACVDTERRRRGRAARQVAAAVQGMAMRGEITILGGPGVMPPPQQQPYGDPNGLWRLTYGAYGPPPPMFANPPPMQMQVLPPHQHRQPQQEKGGAVMYGGPSVPHPHGVPAPGLLYGGPPVAPPHSVPYPGPLYGGPPAASPGVVRYG